MSHNDRARLREQLSEALERAARYEQRYTEVRRERDEVRAHLSLALYLLLRARDMEALPFVERVRLKDAIDAFDVEARG